MLEQSFGRRLPAPLKRRLMLVETRIERELRAFAGSLRAGARVLDAGAGEGRHRAYFADSRYTAVDLGIGDRQWDYSALDALADLSSLPFPDGCFGGAINIVVLEHTRDPGRVIEELARVLAPGGRLLLIAPHAWEVHQSPNDYFRFTRHGLALLFERAGLRVLKMEPIGGYFTLLARRLMNGLNFFRGGLRWLFFPVAAGVGLAAGLVLPTLDGLDSEKNFTLAYVCVVKKP